MKGEENGVIHKFCGKCFDEIKAKTSIFKYNLKKKDFICTWCGDHLKE